MTGMPAPLPPRTPTPCLPSKLPLLLPPQPPRSAISAAEIQQAMARLGAPNRAEALAVDARQELDLKVGCRGARPWQHMRGRPASGWQANVACTAGIVVQHRGRGPSRRRALCGSSRAPAAPAHRRRRAPPAAPARPARPAQVGVAFTRFQSRFFQSKYGNLDSRLISYGPCQTPTLNFCVERHQAIACFQPEPFWVVRPRAAKAGTTLNVSLGRGSWRACVLGQGEPFMSTLRCQPAPLLFPKQFPPPLPCWCFKKRSWSGGGAACLMPRLALHSSSWCRRPSRWAGEEACESWWARGQRSSTHSMLALQAGKWLPAS